MVKTIHVSGKMPALPNIDGFMWPKEPFRALACALAGYDNYPVVKKALRGELGKTEWAPRILEAGPRHCSGFYNCAAAFYADALDEPLEIILNGERPDSMGTLLKRGTLIIRGNLGRETAHSVSSGSMYVDGNVEQIESPGEGILYVRGDVGEIRQAYNGIIIIAGKIKHSSDKVYTSSDTQLHPSPFVFTSRPTTLFGYSPKPGVRITRETTVLPKEEIRSFTPENFKQKALELCKRRLRECLDEEKRMVEEITVPGDAIDFFRERIEGYHFGYSSGYYKGTLDHIPCDD